jgi:hypothetical protein
MADEKATQKPKEKPEADRPAGQDEEPGTQEHLGSDRPYEGGAPEDE